MKYRPRSLTRRLIGLVLVASSVVAIWQSYATTARQARYVECQGQVNTALIESLAQSRETAAQERAATDAVYRALRDSPQDPSAAIDTYFAQRAAADARRAANPLPEPPTSRC